MRERNRFLRGMTVWVGYTQAAVPYHRDPRYAGETKYTIPKMLRFSLDAISSFSHRPLQLATLLGFLISTLAFIAIPVVVVLRILGSYLPGFSALTIVVLLLGGIELIAIGIIGEYVGRIYDEVKGRPLYLVERAATCRRPGRAVQLTRLRPARQPRASRSRRSPSERNVGAQTASGDPSSAGAGLGLRPTGWSDRRAGQRFRAAQRADVGLGALFALGGLLGGDLELGDPAGQAADGVGHRVG